MDQPQDERQLWYADVRPLDELGKVTLKISRRDGRLCVEKHVSKELIEIYQYLAAHPGSHTPEILDIIEQEEELIIIEAYIEGQTLEEKLKTSAFSKQEAVGIICTLCDALRPFHTHTPPIILRDIKAENIMIDTEGELKIIDFDIARLYRKGETRDTKLLGTQEYAAPEQFGYRQSDARTDIYAMGVLLNYLVLKKFPQEEHLTGRLGHIVRKCMAMDPKHRYHDVSDLKRALYAVTGQAEDVTESLLPPGFRTKTGWKMLLAVIGYAALVWFCFSFSWTEIAAMQRPEQFVFLLSQLALVLIIGNYRGIRDHIPVVRSKHRLIRMVAYIILWFALFFLTTFIDVVMEVLWVDLMI